MANENQIVRAMHQMHSMGASTLWIKQGTKRPIYKEWSTMPSLSIDQLMSDYRNGMNLGIRLGKVSSDSSGDWCLVAIDMDVKSSDPADQMEAYSVVESILEDPTIFPRVQSGRGNGSSHFYVWVRVADMPASMKVIRSTKKCTVVIGGEKVTRPCWEVEILADGRQAVLPPSIHPDTGNEYLWRVPFSGTPAVMPEAGYEFLQSKYYEGHNKEGSGQCYWDSDSIPNDLTRREGGATLESLPISDRMKDLIRLNHGLEDRYDTSSEAFWAAIVSMVQAKVDDDTILSVMTDPANALAHTALRRRQGDPNKATTWVWPQLVKAKAKYDTDTKAHMETARLWMEDVRNSQKVELEPRQTADGSVEYVPVSPMVEEALEAQGNIWETDRFNACFSLRQGENTPPPAVEIFWGGPMLFRAGMVVIAGEPKIGKSRFILSLAVSASCGRPFLGKNFSKQLRVFWLQAEIHEAFVMERVNSMTKGLTEDEHEIARDNLFLTGRVSMDLTTDEGFARAEHMIKYAKPDILCVDPVINFSTAEENRNAEMMALLTRCRYLGMQHNCTVVLLHHTKKNPDLSDPFSAIRGAGAIRGWYDTGIVLAGKPEHPVIFYEARNCQTPPVHAIQWDDEECVYNPKMVEMDDKGRYTILDGSPSGMAEAPKAQETFNEKSERETAAVSSVARRRYDKLLQWMNNKGNQGADGWILVDKIKVYASKQFSADMSNTRTWRPIGTLFVNAVTAGEIEESGGKKSKAYRFIPK